jgi:Mlc titration factor MtfA (ptsG expression regulator)
MPADLQLQLKKLIQVFVAEKSFIGCAGLIVTEEMRISIAAQACLLLLNQRHPSCYPNLRQVLVYPAAFIVERLHGDAAGVLQEQRHALSGESWSQGQVILSWEDARAGAVTPDDGQNVVIHEFAHQLDQENGPANGAPSLPRGDRKQWARVLSESFAQLQGEVQRGEEGLFSHYGATNAAEFFAVVSEVFFEQPVAMAAKHPALYREFSKFYRIDPTGW